MEALVFSLPARPAPLVSLRPTSRSALGLAVALATLVLAVICAAPAQAALISTGACSEASLSQPFAPWGDTSSYELVSGGDFEGSLSGWTLSGGAQRVSGSEPFAVTGALGAYSLALPAGASAQSPFTCVDAAYPTFRLFARDDGLASTLVAQVVYQTALGEVVLPLGAVALSGEWQPTLPMLTGSIVTGALSGGTAQVALRFTALTGHSQIDDVFVDPRMH
jgi:hypothetical protein